MAAMGMKKCRQLGVAGDGRPYCVHGPMYPNGFQTCGTRRWICAENERKKKAAWRKTNSERERGYYDRPKRVESTRRWRRENPERTRLLSAEYRARKRDLEYDDRLDLNAPCPLCGRPIDHTIQRGPRMSSIGHEPPLTRAAELPKLERIIRYEHLGCNKRKHNSLDRELTWTQT